MIRRPHRTRRLWALCRKETLQIVRDPSTLLIALAFPVVLLFVFGAGINLDSSILRLGVVLQDASPRAQRFVAALSGSPSFRIQLGHDAGTMSDRLRAGSIRGFVVVRNDFSERIARAEPATPTLLLVTDGAEPNTAKFMATYVRGAYDVWWREEMRREGRARAGGLTLQPRSWFNPSMESRNFLLPGSITIIMTVVGALLTALVIAREWERGTMEALLSAGISRFELLTSKLLPYFALGLISYGLCVGISVWVFEVPLRGSLPALLLAGSLFLGSALGLGLLLSTTLRSQYNAAQAALNVAFLPALMLSGFVFEITSMPWIIRVATRIVPARYFVTAMQTLFQAGDVWSVLWPAFGGLALAAIGFIGLAALKTGKRLE